MTTERTMEERAAAIVDVPGWVPWQFQAIANGVLCTGAVCPTATRGRRKGGPAYRRHDKSTLQQVVVLSTGPALQAILDGLKVAEAHVLLLDTQAMVQKALDRTEAYEGLVAAHADARDKLTAARLALHKMLGTAP